MVYDTANAEADMPIKGWVNNGLADQEGRLTQAGRDALAPIYEKWPAPIAYLSLWPNVKKAVWAVLRKGRSRIDEVMLEDLHQEMWSELVARVSRYDPRDGSGASMETYVLWGFIKGASMWLRRKTREINGMGVVTMLSDKLSHESGLTVSETLVDKTVPVENAEQHGLFGELQFHIDRLPASHRRFVVGRYAEGKTLQQLGTEMGVSKQSARNIEAEIHARLAQSRRPRRRQYRMEVA